ELAWHGMVIFPAVHRRDGDGDLMRELFLGEAESLPKAADQVVAIRMHQVVSPRVPGFDASARSNPHAISSGLSDPSRLVLGSEQWAAAVFGGCCSCLPSSPQRRLTPRNPEVPRTSCGGT